MKYPKGCGFNLTGGLTLTVILEGGYFLVGRFLGAIGDDRKCDCCPPPKIEIENEVEVNDGAEFLLLQLTSAFVVGGLPTFPVGTVVAINVEQILFIGPGTAA
jgi:hypothetical protein